VWEAEISHRSVGYGRVRKTGRTGVRFCRSFAKPVGTGVWFCRSPVEPVRPDTRTGRVPIIHEHFQPGPLARPAHEPYWTGLGSDLATREKILARARPKMFLAILHYKNMGAPPKPGPGPSPVRKTRPATGHGTGVGRIFSARKSRVFSGPAREMLMYSSHPKPCLNFVSPNEPAG
jgi:hypothetical protein